MRRFTEAIKGCLDSQNWYGALFIALAMPDICGTIEYPEDGRPNERYKHWFDAYLLKHYTKHYKGKETIFMRASDCWALRCSIFHKGSDDTSKSTDKENKGKIIKFWISAKNLHLIKSKNKLIINATNFCEDVIQAVEDWSRDIKGDDVKQQQVKELLTILSGEITFYPPVITIERKKL